jgi:hypothetical protein
VNHFGIHTEKKRLSITKFRNISSLSEFKCLTVIEQLQPADVGVN